RFEALEERTLLSLWTVTHNSDDPADQGSLRYAINHEPSGTIINFAPDVNGRITLTNGALKITTDLDIEGPGPSGLAIAGHDATPVFEVSSGVTATIAGLMIVDGSGSNGGGIYNNGTLTANNATLSHNSAANGAGIVNSGTLTLSLSTVSNNSADEDGG